MVHIDEIGRMEPALDLGPDRRLLFVHPARDHLLPNRSLLIGQVGRPELRRVEPRICDLLVAIPLGEILTQVLAQLHSMRLRIARVARELLRQLIEPSRGLDRKSTRLNSSHYCATRMPSSA